MAPAGSSPDSFARLLSPVEVQPHLPLQPHPLSLSHHALAACSPKVTTLSLSFVSAPAPSCKALAAFVPFSEQRPLFSSWRAPLCPPLWGSTALAVYRQKPLSSLKPLCNPEQLTVGGEVGPKCDVHLEPVNVTLFGKKGVSADEVQDPQVRSA